MTQNVDRPEKSQSSVTVPENEKLKLFTEMEESIAMLLDYGQHQPQKPPLRRNLSRQKSNDSNSLTSSLSSTTRKPDSDSLPSDLSRSRGGSSLTMTESIYDNMPKERRRRSQEVVTASPVPKPRIAQPCTISVIGDDISSARITPEQSRKSIKSMDSIDIIQSDQYMNLSTLALPQLSIANRAGSCEMLTACQNEGDNFNLEAKLKNAVCFGILPLTEVAQKLVMVRLPGFGLQQVHRASTLAFTASDIAPSINSPTEHYTDIVLPSIFVAYVDLPVQTIGDVLNNEKSCPHHFYFPIWTRFIEPSLTE
ncbi:hypothetical protein KIN20_011740 [Parelaphostrongylus tenuis]|uniref:Uncharacterized protein n=1 Tax=Parelaphostrongylus tenuis TaxID=148309 RepID=A0AAD5QMN8_PARTN|nr:hypothetical protein KIN20_011740 [Parelaphostrongylus tenuis]